jgi:4-oxalocrotonate tautomerase
MVSSGIQYWSVQRIDLRKGKDTVYRQEIGRVVYNALVKVGVPKNDRFQVIGEHEAEHFLFDCDYIGIPAPRSS